MRAPERIFLSPEHGCRAAFNLTENANDQSAYSKRTPKGVGEIEVTGSDGLSPASRGMRAGDDAHTEEA